MSNKQSDNSKIAKKGSAMNGNGQAVVISVPSNPPSGAKPAETPGNPAKK
jgi:hypothetical protein